MAFQAHLLNYLAAKFCHVLSAVCYYDNDSDHIDHIFKVLTFVESLEKCVRLYSYVCHYGSDIVSYWRCCNKHLN